MTSRAPSTSSLLASAYVFTVVMVGTTLPTPLYPQYQAAFGFGALAVTVLFSVYAGGVILGLVLFGRLSDAVGRRWVLAAGIALSLVSAALFGIGTEQWLLYTGRVLSGLAAGLLTSAGTVSVLENTPEGRSALGSAVATAANIGGLGLGIWLSGAVSQLFQAGGGSAAFWALRAPYLVHAVLLVLAGVALAGLRDPVDPRPGSFRLERPRVPAESRRIFWAAVPGVVLGFAMTGLYSSVVPGLLGSVMHVHAPVLAGLVVGLVFLASATAQIALRGLPDRTLVLTGSAAMCVGLALICLTLVLGSLPLLVAAAAVGGAGQGMLVMSGLRAVAARTDASRRTQATTAFFVVAYLSISVPSVLVGLLVRAVGLVPAGIGSFVALGVLSLTGLFTARAFRD